jgi:hypothetical protein
MQELDSHVTARGGTELPARRARHIPERARLIVRETCEKIVEKCTHVAAYRDNPQRADDYAFGHMCGVFETLRSNSDPLTAAFAGTLLAQVSDGGIEFVRRMIGDATGQEFNGRN